MDRDIAAGEITARGIAVADLNGEEVVIGAGTSVVGHVHTESDLLFSDFGRSSEVGVIVVKAEARYLDRPEREWSTWIAVAEITNYFGLLLLIHLLELDAKIEGGLTAFANRDRAVSINVSWIRGEGRWCR